MHISLKKTEKTVFYPERSESSYPKQRGCHLYCRNPVEKNSCMINGDNVWF